MRVAAMAALCAGLLLLTQLKIASAGNLTLSGAISTFMISQCASCTPDKNAAFCTTAGSSANFVQNGTVKVTIAQKTSDPAWGNLGPVQGVTFCWEGTFGAIKRSHGRYDGILNDNNITVSLDCDLQYIFYNQCFMNAQTAIIIITFAMLGLVGGVLLFLLCCGCLKCCNEKGGKSRALRHQRSPLIGLEIQTGLVFLAFSLLPQFPCPLYSALQTTASTAAATDFARGAQCAPTSTCGMMMMTSRKRR